jgi:hypothetical protein
MPEIKEVDAAKLDKLDRKIESFSKIPMSL